MKSLRSVGLVWMLSAMALIGRTAEPVVTATVAKAREFLGGESTLSKVTSLQFVGDLEVVQDGIKVKPEDRARRFTVEFIFQKPGQQVMKRSDGKNLEIVGLSDYDGWTRIEPVGDPSKWRMLMLDSRKIRRLQASTFDSLNFFANPEKHGGKLEFRTEGKESGRDVVTLAYVHPGDVTFVRTFDKKTGQLLHTVTDEGETFREEGEMKVAGLRFAQRVISTVTRDGVAQTATITFREIRVNEKFDSAIFEMPSTTGK